MHHPAIAAALLVGTMAPPVGAQEQPISQAVVQPLPPQGVSELNAALRRLARDSLSVDALLDAGYASLNVDDIEAALGFFGRAQELSPGNARVKVGLAASYVRSQRPVEALRLFEEAERAGASTLSLAGDRGLAYDLVGDNAAAQEQYARALNGPDGDEIRRRLALSQAIAGNREAFEQTLYPLTERRDFAAYRIRAFALAIMGEEDEAIAITEAVMPRDLAARMAPYLRYMDRLTPSQQAAAANLGIFPRAARIGRDDPAIAQYRSGSSAVRQADAALAPAGPPLGAEPREDRTSPRRRPGRGTSAVGPEREVRETRRVELPTAPPVNAVTSEQPVEEVVAARQPDTPQSEQPAEAQVASADVAQPVVQPVPEADAPRPGFDLARLDSAPATPASDDTETAPANVADAFASFSLPPGEGSVAAARDAVDITTIEPPREVEEKEKAAPPPPRHPSRIWVQVATGRDRSALRFDWRRLTRQAPEILSDLEPHVTPWGVANRLLAGPYVSTRAARDAVNALKAEGIDSFTFTSDEGQEIEQL